MMRIVHRTLLHTCAQDECGELIYGQLVSSLLVMGDSAQHLQAQQQQWGWCTRPTADSKPGHVAANYACATHRNDCRVAT